MTDSEILDAIAEQHKGDLAVQACIQECREGLSLPVIDRMALAKKLQFAISSKVEAPVMTPTARALRELH